MTLEGLNGDQEREYNRDIIFQKFLIEKKKEYETYMPFNDEVQLLFENIGRVEPFIPIKGKKGVAVTKRKDATKESLATDVNEVCTNVTAYALSIADDDLQYAVRFRTRDITNAKDGNVPGVVTTITEAVTPLLTEEAFQKYEITAETLASLTRQAQAFSDTRGKAKAINTDSNIANGDLNEVFTAIRANIARLRLLVSHFNKKNPNFVQGFHTTVAVDHSGIRHSGIEGVITNPATGMPVDKATITGEGKKKFVITKIDGKYRLVKLKIGFMKITVTSPGYEPQIIDIKVIRGKIIELNISLQSQVVRLNATA